VAAKDGRITKNSVMVITVAPVVGGFAVVGGGFVVGGLVTVGDGSSVVSEYSARKPRSGENEE